MPNITNNTTEDVKCESGHVIPAGGSLSVTGPTLDRIIAHPRTGRMFRDRDLVVEHTEVKDKAPEKITRKYIAKAKRADLVELLEAHGVADLDGFTVDELREQLTAIMFVDEDAEV